MQQATVIANWKMHGDINFIDSYFADFNVNSNAVEVVFTVPYVYLGTIANKLKSSEVKFGAQNVSHLAEGAYTGEVSAHMLSDFNARYVLVGHSERRSLYGETNSLVAAKFIAATSANLVPVLCVGESQQEREEGHTSNIIKKQLQEVINHSEFNHNKEFLLAYEPIWAIGTGKVPSCQEIQQVHAFLRDLLREVNADLASRTRILYGGSLKPENALEIFQCQDVNGGLVGGASLAPDVFKEVIELCNKSCLSYT